MFFGIREAFSRNPTTLEAIMRFVFALLIGFALGYIGLPFLRSTQDKRVICYDPMFVDAQSPLLGTWYEQKEASCNQEACVMRDEHTQTIYRLPEGAACSIVEDVSVERPVEPV